MGQWWVLSLIDGNYTGCVLIMKCARQRGRLNIYKYMRLGYGLIRFLPHCRICFPNFFVPDRKQQPRLVAGIKLCDSFLPCSQLKVFCNETDSKARDRIVSIYHADCRHRVRMMSLLRSSSGSTPSINLRECGRWRTLKIKKSRNENHTSSDKTDMILHQASRTCFNQCSHSCTNTDFRLSLSTWTVCRVPSTSRPKVWPTYSVIAQVVLVVYSTRTNILLVWECIYVVSPRMSCDAWYGTFIHNTDERNISRRLPRSKKESEVHFVESIYTTTIYIVQTFPRRRTTEQIHKDTHMARKGGGRSILRKRLLCSV